MNISQLYGRLCVNSQHICRYSGYSTSRLADFPAGYKAKDAKQGWYDVWEKNKYFADENSCKEPLRMILPPPNVTGTLHLGHGLTVVIQDVLARWYRMKGHPVVWIPGLDHAGIATQMMVEKHILKIKGISKFDIGREKFVSHVWEWKEQKEDTIKEQLKDLGATLDWSKEYFTMDKDHSNAVTEAFIILNERDLIFREKKLINWSPTLRSAISEIEVKDLHITEKTELEVPGYKRKVLFGELAHIAYTIKDSEDEIIVATTRPETVFGDVAIAVHPDNERYLHYIGQQVWHPIRETYIPVIADSAVDMEFGTGAMKITPAHNQTDYLIAKKHQLDIINAIDEQGNITEAGKQFQGMPRFIARVKVLNELSNRGLLRGVQDHKMCIPLCSRSHDVVEYLLKEQWYIRCKEMAQQAIQAVKTGELKIVPDYQRELWYNWLENIRDWCISRQTWWGHRIPAYKITAGDRTEWIISRTENNARNIAQAKYGPDVEIRQDEDVLDTWFSSAIIPFAVMGWPKKGFEQHYPLTLMETGYDILFFWVARMVMLGLELTNRLPFQEVLLHGIVCDGLGRKMSKTLGNVILPENVINGIPLETLAEQVKEGHKQGVIHRNELKRTLKANKKMFPNGVPECGVDALRFTLCSYDITNRTIHFDILMCQANKFFCNKIWQLSKFILMRTNETTLDVPKSFTVMDRWILSRLSLMIQTVDDAFMTRKFHVATKSINQFLHYELCDYYLEGSKVSFNSENTDVIASHTHTLIKCLEVSLRVLAPITPYLADDLYTRLAKKLPTFLPVTSLMEAPYPTPDEFRIWRDEDLDNRMIEVLKVIVEIRSLLASVSKQTNPKVFIVISNDNDYDFYKNNLNLIKGATKIFATSVDLARKYVPSENSICYKHSSECSVYITILDASAFGMVRSKVNLKM